MYTAAKDDTVRTLKQDNIGSTVVDAAHDAGRKVRGFIDSATDELTHAKETVTKEIRTNPVQSSVIALGVGFVLGALFRR